MARLKGSKTKKPTAYYGRTEQIKSKFGSNAYRDWGKLGGNPCLLRERASGMNKMDNVVSNQLVEGFFSELETLCRKYNLSIAHEDNQGAFIIQRYKHSNMIWLKSASRETK